MTRTDVINYLIKEYGFKSYLEIGTQTKAQNFDKIECDVKVCVDKDSKSEADFIMTSDEFFGQNDDSFDLIFIDGDHSFKQSSKDFSYAMRCLEDDGVIVMHDTLPDNLEYTKPEWCGEVYKTALDYSHNMLVKTMNADHGVSVFYPFVEFEGKGKEVLYSYNLEYLLNELNAVGSLEGLKHDEPTIDEVFGISEQIDGDYDHLDAHSTNYTHLSDEDLIKEWKSQTGRKRLPKGGFDREELIKDLA